MSLSAVMKRHRTLPAMTPDEFRRQGHALIDWIADYVEGVEQYPVASPVAPGDVRAQLPSSPPDGPEDFAAVLADVDRVIVPGLTHWQHPSFFAYFPANSTYPAILGELLSAGLGVNGMLWATSPACTELETLMCDWMAELLDLPARFRSDGPGGGVIQGTASEATLCAILAARERATEGRSNEAGASGRLVAYATAHTHSATEKGLKVAGIGRDNLRLVGTDASFAMQPDALAATVAADRGAGLVPFVVCATAGTTSSLAFDPVPAIADVCRRERLWLHVDAAMAGVAAVCPEYRWVNAGVEAADSYCTNPHKWMGINFDCDLLYVADRAALINTFSILPPFLRTAHGDAGTVIDYRDWGIPLGRRFRALKVWFTLRADGPGPTRAMIRRHVALAADLASWVEADSRFELATPPRLNLVCLRHADGDAATDGLLTAANASGRALFTRTVLDGRSVLRFCVGGRATERRHVAAAWQLLQELA
jgi:aromatic-L-amino-acid/L-tryptophan decarboxylase